MLRKDVQEMLDNEGLYLAFDPEASEALVPIYSRNGKLHAIKLEEGALDPRGFFDRTRFHGPFWPLEKNLLAR